MIKRHFAVELMIFSELPTVVMDAGIATAKNLELVTGEGFHYITVSWKKPEEKPAEGLLTIRENKDGKVEIKKIKEESGEVVVYCQSTGRAKKETGMKTKFQQQFEEGLERIRTSLSKKGGRKGYGHIMERIGRLKQKHPRIARFYRIDVTEEEGKAGTINWEIDQKDDLEMRFSGAYYLRSSRTDLSEKELWEL